jgi:hypothetical protein
MAKIKPYLVIAVVVVIVIAVVSRVEKLRTMIFGA